MSAAQNSTSSKKSKTQQSTPTITGSVELGSAESNTSKAKDKDDVKKLQKEVKVLETRLDAMATENKANAEKRTGFKLCITTWRRMFQRDPETRMECDKKEKKKNTTSDRPTRQQLCKNIHNFPASQHEHHIRQNQLQTSHAGTNFLLFLFSFCVTYNTTLAYILLLCQRHHQTETRAHQFHLLQLWVLQTDEDVRSCDGGRCGHVT
ncbi:hypothetical protein V8C42DRAFT_327266 [Trichoderma barbatum]